MAASVEIALVAMARGVRRRRHAGIRVGERIDAGKGSIRGRNVTAAGDPTDDVGRLGGDRGAGAGHRQRIAARRIVIERAAGEVHHLAPDGWIYHLRLVGHGKGAARLRTAAMLRCICLPSLRHSARQR